MCIYMQEWELNKKKHYEFIGLLTCYLLIYTVYMCANKYIYIYFCINIIIINQLFLNVY